MAVNIKTVFDVLEANRLPQGLLPLSVTDYEMDEDGNFTVHLSEKTYVTFGEGEPGAKLVFYDMVLGGKLKDLQITNLTGVSAKKAFIWVSIGSIIRATGDSTTLKFFWGLIGLELPVRWFERKS